MYRNILIPVVFDENDMTPASFGAARALAQDGAKITLMHVIETVPAYASQYISSEILNTAKKAVTIKLTNLAKQMPGCDIAMTDGKPGPQILQWAEQNGTDCIVIASHQPAFSDILLGSVAQHVVRHAKCAVHIVK